MLFLSSSEERRAIFEKIDAALGLIRDNAPLRFAQVCRDLKRILVCGDASTAGSYIADLQMCDLFFNYVLSSQTQTQDVAATLVHEAQHGRLRRLGFLYDEAMRARVERVCYRAERGFGLRLASGASVVALATQNMNADPGLFSESAHLEAQARSLGDLKLPAWFAAIASYWMKRRAKQARIAEGRGEREPPNDEMQRTAPGQSERRR